MTDLQELQGELLALRCHVAALIEVLPLNSALRYRTKLERRSLVIRECLSESGQAGFDRELIALSVTRQAG